MREESGESRRPPPYSPGGYERIPAGDARMLSGLRCVPTPACCPSTAPSRKRHPGAGLVRARVICGG